MEKRKKKKRFVLRNDIFGSHLHLELGIEDYFDFSFAFPDEADKIIVDGMYAGDWYSIYESKILPLRRKPMFARFHSAARKLSNVAQTPLQGREKYSIFFNSVSLFFSLNTQNPL